MKMRRFRCDTVFCNAQSRLLGLHLVSYIECDSFLIVCVLCSGFAKQCHLRVLPSFDVHWRQLVRISFVPVAGELSSGLGNDVCLRNIDHRVTSRGE